jgi:hypothetical protein
VRERAHGGNHNNREYKPQHNRKTSAQKSAKCRKYHAEQYKNQYNVHDVVPPIIFDAFVIVVAGSQAVPHANPNM